jgi:hypothetical protein
MFCRSLFVLLSFLFWLLNYYVSKVKDNVTLQCLINDDPSNTIIYWKKESNYVNTNLWKYSGGILTNPSLTIKNVQLSDAGRIYSLFVILRFRFFFKNNKS